jgi:2-octaprenyl-6-methoxyphenol hydroxylase
MPSTTKAAQTFDLIIAGGGLSGVLMALSVADLQHHSGQKLSIAIVEHHPLTEDISSSYDARVLALAHGSAQYLRQLAIWPKLKNDACAIQHIHVSDRGHYGKARLQASDYQVSALGYVVEMAQLGAILMQQLASKANVHWFCPEQIADIQWQTNAVNVHLASNQLLQAPLLLGCDGAQSQCRQLAGIAVSRYDYQQTAVIANLSTEYAHQGRAFERFTEFGPIAMLPLSKNRCSLVWTISQSQAQQVMQLSDAEFLVELQQAFGSWLGAITQVGQRVSFDLALVQAQRNSYHRMALVGNASHTIHPIAGQGFNLGLRDVQQLSELIKSALAEQQDLGSLALLNRYDRLRAKDQRQVIQLTDTLVSLFSNALPPLVLGRNIGLKVLNYVTPLKSALAGKTMGH